MGDGGDDGVCGSNASTDTMEINLKNGHGGDTPPWQLAKAWDLRGTTPPLQLTPSPVDGRGRKKKTRGKTRRKTRRKKHRKTRRKIFKRKRTRTKRRKRQSNR